VVEDAALGEVYEVLAAFLGMLEAEAQYMGSSKVGWVGWRRAHTQRPLPALAASVVGQVVSQWWPCAVPALYLSPRSLVCELSLASDMHKFACVHAQWHMVCCSENGSRLLTWRSVYLGVLCMLHEHTPDKQLPPPSFLPTPH
jgi:hypothetical protein